MLKDTEQRVIEVIKRDIGLTYYKVENLSADTNISQLGINSITFIKLIVALETEFNIEFGESYLDYGNFTDISSISSYIETVLNASE